MDITGNAVRNTLRMTALSLALGATSVLAQDIVDTPGTDAVNGDSNTPSRTFETITVNGELDIEKTPWVTETSRETLNSRQVTDLNEFGSRIEPGVNYSRATRGVNIRGLEGPRVVTKLDGIRLNFMKSTRAGGPGGAGVVGGSNAFDFGSLSSIDVIRGTDSTAAGSGALGGVLDLRSLRPEDVVRKGEKFGFLGRSGYQSMDNSWLLNGALAGKTDLGLQWLIHAGVREGHEIKNRGTRGGYGSNRTQANPRSYTQQNYLLRLEQTFAGGHEIGLTGSFYQRRDDITNLNADVKYYALGSDKVRENTGRETVALDYQWISPTDDAWIDRVATKLYWQKQKIWNTKNAMRIDSMRGPYYRKNSMEESTYGVEMNTSKAFRGAVSQLWEMGAEYYESSLKQMAEGRDSCPPNARRPPCAMIHNNQADSPKTDGKHYAIWLQNTLGFMDDRLSVMPAIRFDDYKYTPKISGDFRSNPVFGTMPANSGQAWSPKVLVSLKPIEDLTLYTQYAIGFNAPTATQLYSRYGSPTTYLYEGNPNLKPERSRGWEFGARVGDEKLNASIAYFDNRYTNFIEAVKYPSPSKWLYRMGGITRFENLDNVRIYGLEARAHWAFHKAWNVYGSLAWTEGKDRGSDTYLSSVAPLKGILGLAYEHDEWGVRGQMTLVAKRNHVKYPNNTKEMKADFRAPGYGIVDLTAYWKPSRIKGLTIQAGIFNVLDKVYWHALDVPHVPIRMTGLGVDHYTQPGRNFSINLTYQY